MATDNDTLSIAAFTALGTIAGYLGTEVASDSIFARLLWPSRFYNDIRWSSFLAISLLMPMGGPIHKAAVEALDQFALSGLWKGYCQGDMLKTAFYRDTGHHYVVRMGKDLGQTKEARNAFWITVMGCIQWQPIKENASSASTTDDEAAGKRVEKVIAQRPVFFLKLSRCTGSTGDKNIPVVNGDIGDLKFRYLVGIMASEVTTIAVGIVIATVWKSFFALWFLAPLLLKLIALLCHIRRTSIKPEPKKTSTKGKEQATTADEGDIVCQVVDFSKGFFLIKGPSELVLQFFRHYGHPERYHRGFRGDRVREVIAMITVILSVMVYPGGLVAFIFATQTIQWIWLGYQLYAMLAMHFYRFCGGESIGTTEKWVARELKNKGKVCFDDGSGNRVIAELDAAIVRSVAEGRTEVEKRLEQILGNHA